MSFRDAERLVRHMDAELKKNRQVCVLFHRQSETKLLVSKTGHGRCASYEGCGCRLNSVVTGHEFQCLCFFFVPNASRYVQRIHCGVLFWRHRMHFEMGTT